MLVETFLRKQLGLKAHTVTKVEETDRFMIVHIERLGRRLLRCGVCRQRCRKVHSVRKPREWRDLSMRKLPLKLRYRPRRVECPRSAGGGLSLGGPLGASDHGAVECGGEAGAGVELAGNGSPVRIELEERGDHRETSGGIWSGSSSANAGACHRHR